MSTPGRRKIMARTLAEFFVKQGRMLTAAEYSEMGDSTPYRITSIEKHLGHWARAMEKVKTSEPDLMSKIAAAPAALSILEKMQQALNKGA